MISITRYLRYHWNITKKLKIKFNDGLSNVQTSHNYFSRIYLNIEISRIYRKYIPIFNTIDTIISTMSSHTRINDGDSNTARWTWISSTIGRWPVSCLFIVALLRLNCYLVLTLWDIRHTCTYMYICTHALVPSILSVGQYDLDKNYFILFKLFRDIYIFTYLSILSIMNFTIYNKYLNSEINFLFR